MSLKIEVRERMRFATCLQLLFVALFGLVSSYAFADTSTGVSYSEDSYLPAFEKGTLKPNLRQDLGEARGLKGFPRVFLASGKTLYSRPYHDGSLEMDRGHVFVASDDELPTAENSDAFFASRGVYGIPGSMFGDQVEEVSTEYVAISGGSAKQARLYFCQKSAIEQASYQSIYALTQGGDQAPCFSVSVSEEIGDFGTEMRFAKIGQAQGVLAVDFSAGVYFLLIDSTKERLGIAPTLTLGNTEPDPSKGYLGKITGQDLVAASQEMSTHCPGGCQLGWSMDTISLFEDETEQLVLGAPGFIVSYQERGAVLIVDVAKDEPQILSVVFGPSASSGFGTNTQFGEALSVSTSQRVIYTAAPFADLGPQRLDAGAVFPIDITVDEGAVDMSIDFNSVLSTKGEHSTYGTEILALTSLYPSSKIGGQTTELEVVLAAHGYQNVNSAVTFTAVAIREGNDLIRFAHPAHQSSLLGMYTASEEEIPVVGVTGVNLDARDEDRLGQEWRLMFTDNLIDGDVARSGVTRLAVKAPHPYDFDLADSAHTPSYDFSQDIVNYGMFEVSAICQYPYDALLAESKSVEDLDPSVDKLQQLLPSFQANGFWEGGKPSFKISVTGTKPNQEMGQGDGLVELAEADGITVFLVVNFGPPANTAPHYLSEDSIFQGISSTSWCPVHMSEGNKMAVFTTGMSGGIKLGEDFQYPVPGGKISYGAGGVPITASLIVLGINGEVATKTISFTIGYAGTVQE